MKVVVVSKASINMINMKEARRMIIDQYLDTEKHK